MIKYFSLILLLHFSIISLAVKKSKISSLPQQNFPDWADTIFNKMNTDEKIAQLFMVAAYSNRDALEEEKISYLIKKYKIGGLIFFQGNSKNQVRLTNIYQELSDVPLLIAMDAEWGLGMRLDSVITYPKQMTLGAIQDNHLIYEMGQDIARQMDRIGVHINFAPVVDINNNPNNPVINYRSFGEDKNNVANKGLAYALGLQDNHIMAVAKHFPGHGDTDTDSHYNLPLISHTRERLENIELFPFKHLIKNRLKGIMTAHLSIPAYEPEPRLSSSLSKNIVDSLLKQDLGFDGLIFTDALNMKGATKYFEPGFVDLQALLAGNDVLLFPEDVPKAIKVIKKAIRKKELSLHQIENSCKKILKAKLWAGLNHYQPVNNSEIDKDLNKPEYISLKNKLFESSLTLLENQENIIPLKKLDTLKIASIAIGSNELNTFQKTLQLYYNIKTCNIDKNASKNDFNALLEELTDCNLFIFSIHNTSTSPSKKFGITQQTIDFINNLPHKERSILNFYANPYSLVFFDSLPEFAGVLLSYEDNDISEYYSAQLLFGGIPAQGKLPVSINEKYRAGYGITYDDKIRFKYSLPEDVNMSSDTLNQIDSIAINAIREQATPGCQILVARKGSIIYNKSFGYHTYLKKKSVKKTDLYDIASITKIAGTLPALMKLYQEKTITLDAPLSNYLPEIDTTNKANLMLIDILTHQARLNGWIPFYLSTMESLYPEENLLSNKLSDEYPLLIGSNIYLRKHYQFIEGLYSFFKNPTHSIPVAKNLYLINSYKDSIFLKINSSELKEKKEYKYSDLGFYYLKKIVEKISKCSIDEYTGQNFYQSLGLSNIMYKPIGKIDSERIIPTENDFIFRKQLLKGYVHDPGAAMLGGIGGHAGLFSNAGDLAIIMQMFLNKGKYGGIEFLSDSTIQLFSSSPFIHQGNRRGIGFDKPETNKSKPSPAYKNISPNSYGHTGFTGTMAWADPDQEIIYIFLSNRIHPDQNNRKLIDMNVRTNIQKVIYQSIIR